MNAGNIIEKKEAFFISINNSTNLPVNEYHSYLPGYYFFASLLRGVDQDVFYYLQSLVLWYNVLSWWIQSPGRFQLFLIPYQRVISICISRGGIMSSGNLYLVCFHFWGELPFYPSHRMIVMSTRRFKLFFQRCSQPIKAPNLRLCFDVLIWFFFQSVILLSIGIVPISLSLVSTTISSLAHMHSQSFLIKRNNIIGK